MLNQIACGDTEHIHAIAASYPEIAVECVESRNFGILGGCCSVIKSPVPAEAERRSFGLGADGKGSRNSGSQQANSVVHGVFSFMDDAAL